MTANRLPDGRDGSFSGWSREQLLVAVDVLDAARSEILYVPMNSASGPGWLLWSSGEVVGLGALESETVRVFLEHDVLGRESGFMLLDEADSLVEVDRVITVPVTADVIDHLDSILHDRR